MTEKDKPETKIYCDCMSEIRDRMAVIRINVEAVQTAKKETFHQIEMIFIQFRKILELMAFSSLTANRAKYVAVRRAMADEWNATALIKSIERIHPEFWPEALEAPVVQADGTKFFGRPTNGFLTKDGFVRLYGICGEVLHAQNPFSKKDTAIKIGKPIDEWTNQIRMLLRWHLVKLIDGGIWVCRIPSDGPVEVFPAAPRSQPPN
jgi:hypothetical protein